MPLEALEHLLALLSCPRPPVAAMSSSVSARYRCLRAIRSARAAHQVSATGACRAADAKELLQGLRGLLRPAVEVFESLLARCGCAGCPRMPSKRRARCRSQSSRRCAEPSLSIAGASRRCRGARCFSVSRSRRARCSCALRHRLQPARCPPRLRGRVLLQISRLLFARVDSCSSRSDWLQRGLSAGLREATCMPGHAGFLHVTCGSARR